MLSSQLLEASKSGDLDKVQQILNMRPELINCRDVDDRNSTPLHFAARHNQIEVVKLLLGRGADVHIKDKG